MAEPSLSELWNRARRGEAGASAALGETIYPELRRLAHHYLASERRGHTLQTGDLVNEAWVRLFGAAAVPVTDRSHLIALLATQMRRVLVDYARHRNALKGPGSGMRVAVEPESQIGTGPDEDLMALDQALTALEAVDPRASKVVELRFFGGLQEAEAAAALDVSVATLKRDWSFARAWLYDRLRHTS